MRQIAGRALQRETAQRHDQARLFGMGDEIRGRNQALFGMVPAQQRLEARNRAVLQSDDRLVVDVELVLTEGAAQIRFERHSIAMRQSAP